MSRTVLAVANLLLAMLFVGLAGLAAIMGVLAWFAHPCFELELIPFALMCLGIIALIAVLGAIHGWAAWTALKGNRRWPQAVLAVLYLIACPVGVVVVAPSIWTGATGIALLYVCIFLLGIAYALIALLVVWLAWVVPPTAR